MLKIKYSLLLYSKGSRGNACKFSPMCIAAPHKLVCLFTSLLKKMWKSCTYLLIHLPYAALSHPQSQAWDVIWGNCLGTSTLILSCDNCMHVLGKSLLGFLFFFPQIQSLDHLQKREGKNE